MKQFILFVCLSVSLFGYGQNKKILKGIHDIKFFGVDYSSVTIIGANESLSEFKEAFEAINDLFITQPKKFDAGRLLNKNVVELSLTEANSLIDNIDEDAFDYRNRTQPDLQDQIQKLPIKKDKGVGVIIVAKYLDKSNNEGIYQIVFFDLNNKHIIHSWENKGKAGGFGLRNFWGNSVHRLLKSQKL